MSDVPPELFPDILARVPVMSLLRFRCVCKAWLRIIDDPDFIKWHLRLQTEEGQLIFCNHTGNKLYTLSVDSLNNSETPISSTVVASPLKILPRGGASRIPTLPMSSCNGLILISKHGDDVWAVWNPFTREAHVLPSYTNFSLAEGGHRFCNGLGYDSVADDYKVVKITIYYDQTAEDFRCGTLVYSLKSNSWGRVKDCPYFPLLGVPGVFSNGAVHWICLTTRGEEELILAFDLATLDYNLLSPPSIISETGLCLSASAGYLLLTCQDSVYRLDDYGGENSWTKLFSFSGMRFGNVRPITYLKSREEVLLQRYADEYFWFDIKKKTAKRVIIRGDIRSSQICQESLVRLNNYGGGIDGSNSAKETTLWRRNTANDRLQLTVTTTDVEKTTDNVRKTSGSYILRAYGYYM